MVVEEMAVEVTVVVVDMELVVAEVLEQLVEGDKEDKVELAVQVLADVVLVLKSFSSSNLLPHRRCNF